MLFFFFRVISAVGILYMPLSTCPIYCMTETCILRFGIPTNTSSGIGGLFIHEKWHGIEAANISEALQFYVMII